MPLTPEEALELEELKRQQAIALGRAVPGQLPPGVAEPTLGRVAQPQIQSTPEIIRPEKLEQAVSIIPETAGAILGGVLGGPPGAVLGGAGGEALEQLGRRAIGVEAPETGTEAARDIALAGLFAGAGEVGGRALGGLLSKLIPSRPLSKSVTREGEEALQLLRSKGITPPPAQVTENRMIDILQNIGEGSLFGGQRITKAKAVAKEAIDDDIRAFYNQFEPQATADEVGKLLQDTLEGNAKAFRTVGNAKFGNVDDLIGTEAVDFVSTKKLAREIIEEKGIIDPKTKQMANQILRENDVISFKDAQKFRSSLLAITKGKEALVAGQAAARGKQLSQTIDEAMEISAKNVSDEAVDLWRNANEFWKQGRELFDERLITKIATERPDAAMAVLLKEKTPSLIRDVRKLLIKEKPELWKGIQAEFLRGIWPKFFGRKSGVLEGNLIKGALRQFDERLLNELFPKGELKQLQKLARAEITIRTGQPTAVGKLAVEVGQTGAILSIGIKTAKALAILLTPIGLSRAMTNPRIVNFIISGSKGLKTAQAATKFATQLAAQIAKEDISIELQEIITQRKPTMMEKLSQVGEVPDRPIERFTPTPRKQTNRLKEALGKTKVIP